MQPNKKTTPAEKAKINARFEKSTMLFLVLTNEQLQEIQKTWKVDVMVNEQRIKFSCSSTDKMAFYRAGEIKSKQAFANSLK
jgi:hypothetical protein